MKILQIKTEKRLLGNWGEKAARRFLRKNGYKTIKKNFVADQQTEEAKTEGTALEVTGAID